MLPSPTGPVTPGWTCVAGCAGAPVNVYFTPSIFRQQVPKPGAGRDVFDALVRQVDRIDDSYKN